MNDPIANIESNVRGYARLFPAVFDTAVGSRVFDQTGRPFVDFFCGAGTLNYGHNHRGAKAALLAYLTRDGIQHSLDTVTSAKVEFLEAFRSTILAPRSMEYRVQFTGPTGTNAVEAAIKLARKQTGRSHVVAFTNGYHGHSLGSLALTGNQYYHDEAFGSHNNVTHLPFDGYLGDFDTASLLEKMLVDGSSGLPKPAAVILETIQGEGGVNVASHEWLARVASICTHHDIRLIVDDIQVGNGRSGTFFSFEKSGIKPDLICLSKAIGGGLPMSLVLIAEGLDVWQPGQHTGTFRGNNLAFVAATEVLKHWADPEFEPWIEQRSQVIQSWLAQTIGKYPNSGMTRRGRGMIWGLDVGSGEVARQIIGQCFDRGLLIESSGADDHVLKIMPALTIEMDLLGQGLDLLATAVDHVLADRKTTPSANANSVTGLTVDLSGDAGAMFPGIASGLTQT